MKNQLKALMKDPTAKGRFLRTLIFAPLCIIFALLYNFSPSYRNSLGTMGTFVITAAAVFLILELMKTYREWKIEEAHQEKKK